MNDAPPLRQIDGACHCGNIRFSFFMPQTEGPIAVRLCSCSFCRKHGGVYTSHPKGRVEVKIADRSQVNPYHFGTATADFHVCATCGVVPVITSEIEGQLYAVVNVNAFEGVGPADLNPAVADFEGETSDSRLERRQRTWIANVKID